MFGRFFVIGFFTQILIRLLPFLIVAYFVGYYFWAQDGGQARVDAARGYAGQNAQIAAGAKPFTTEYLRYDGSAIRALITNRTQAPIYAIRFTCDYRDAAGDSHRVYSQASLDRVPDGVSGEVSARADIVGDPRDLACSWNYEVDRAAVQRSSGRPTLGALTEATFEARPSRYGVTVEARVSNGGTAPIGGVEYECLFDVAAADGPSLGNQTDPDPSIYGNESFRTRQGDARNLDRRVRTEERILINPGETGRFEHLFSMQVAPRSTQCHLITVRKGETATEMNPSLRVNY